MSFGNTYTKFKIESKNVPDENKKVISANLQNNAEKTNNIKLKVFAESINEELINQNTSTPDDKNNFDSKKVSGSSKNSEDIKTAREDKSEIKAQENFNLKAKSNNEVGVGQKNMKIKPGPEKVIKIAKNIQKVVDSVRKDTQQKTEKNAMQTENLSKTQEPVSQLNEVNFSDGSNSSLKNSSVPQETASLPTEKKSLIASLASYIPNSVANFFSNNNPVKDNIVNLSDQGSQSQAKESNKAVINPTVSSLPEASVDLAAHETKQKQVISYEEVDELLAELNEVANTLITPNDINVKTSNMEPSKTNNDLVEPLKTVPIEAIAELLIGKSEEIATLPYKITNNEDNNIIKTSNIEAVQSNEDAIEGLPNFVNLYEANNLSEQIVTSDIDLSTLQSVKLFDKITQPTNITQPNNDFTDVLRSREFTSIYGFEVSWSEKLDYLPELLNKYSPENIDDNNEISFFMQKILHVDEKYAEKKKQILKTLAEKGFKPNSLIIESAIYRDELDKTNYFKLLLNNLDINQFKIESSIEGPVSILEYAITLNYPKAVETLITAGADINELNLMEKAVENNNKQIINLLLDAGVKSIEANLASNNVDLPKIDQPSMPVDNKNSIDPNIVTIAKFIEIGNLVEIEALYKAYNKFNKNKEEVKKIIKEIKANPESTILKDINKITEITDEIVMNKFKEIYTNSQLNLSNEINEFGDTYFDDVSNFESFYKKFNNSEFNIEVSLKKLQSVIFTNMIIKNGVLNALNKNPEKLGLIIQEFKTSTTFDNVVKENKFFEDHSSIMEKLNTDNFIDNLSNFFNNGNLDEAIVWNQIKSNFETISSNKLDQSTINSFESQVNKFCDDHPDLKLAKESICDSNFDNDFTTIAKMLFVENPE